MSKVVKYRIAKIYDPQFKVEEKPSDFRINGDDCEVTLGINLNFDVEKSNVIVDIGINYEDKRTKSSLLTLKSIIMFEIYDIKNTFDVTEDKKMSVPDGFLIDAISLSIGTARGILIMINQNNYLKEIYLPVFNAQDLLDGLKKQLSSYETKVVE